MSKYIEFSGLKREQFQVKNNLKHVLQSVKYCGFCLENEREMFYHNLNDFSRFDKEINFCTLSKMVEEIFGPEIKDNIPSKYVCSLCKESLEQCYIFMSKVKNTAKVLSSYLDQIDQHIKDVVQMIEQSDEGDFANTVIVLHDDDEPEESIQDLLPAGQEKLDKDPMEKENLQKSDSGKEMDVEDANSEDFQSNIALQDRISIRKKRKCKKRKIRKEACTECKTVPCVHEQYLSSLDLRKQIQKSSDVMIFIKCISCDYVCNSKVSLIAHVNKMHLNRYPYLCETCGQAFHSRRSHYHHIKNTHVENFICNYCDEEVKSDFVEHVIICKNEVRPFKCKLCDASFGDEERLKSHEENHNTQYTCHVCLKTFTNSLAYNMHRAKAHMRVKIQHNISTVNNIRKIPERVCSICFEKFSTLVQLKLHLSLHGPEEKHNCIICIKEFDTRAQYQTHKKSAKHLRKSNPNVKFNIKCPDCDYTCQSNRYLEHHKNVLHLKKKPYKCDVCSKTFTTKETLKGHIDLHIAVKKHKCNHCDSRFLTTTGLKKHMFSQHLEEKPFPCDLCDKTFVYRSEYELHKLRSHSERSVICPLCDGKFHAISNVRRHIVSVHAKGKNLEEFLMIEGGGRRAVALQEILRDRRLPVIPP